MDYSKLSDFEINAAVFEVLHGGAPDYKEGDGGAMVLISYEGDVVGGDAVEVEVERGVFNPCSNPADAWPIIESNRIGVMPSEMKTKELWMCTTGKGSYSYHENPLRAAMIVFLKMQDSANVQDNPSR
ncbi:hypothetical protein E5AUHO_13890 [Citrobacter freundii]|nr:hypothetical protein E5AUHO_13890 [Citrobacter freundii]